MSASDLSTLKCHTCGSPLPLDADRRAFDWLTGEFTTDPETPATCKDCWLSMPAAVSADVVLDHRGFAPLKPSTTTGFGLSSNYYPDDSDEELSEYGHGKIEASATRGLNRAARRAARAKTRY